LVFTRFYLLAEVDGAVRYAFVLGRVGLAAAFAVSLLVVGGCGRGCSEKELGTIVYEVPNVPGSEKTFLLPKLDPAAKSSETTDSSPNTTPPGDVVPLK
jgi:hypothetical protein